MQFLPATFEQYAVDDGDGDLPSPFDIGDAAAAAARMLCANGATRPGGLRQAIWAYNHSDRYVDAVLEWATRYEQAAASSVAGPRGAIAAAWALAQLGKPYEWGAAGPDSYDCSGLTLRAWEAAGVSVPRVAADQYAAGQRVPLASAQPGDLVFFTTDPADPASIDHVGLVVGPGVMIDAPHSGAVVRVTSIYPGAMPEVVRPG
jgi:cell wall-associated NlpC family hydrolase